MFKHAAWLTLTLALVPCAAMAEPVRVALTGDYRPLTASEGEGPEEGFEAGLVAMLTEGGSFHLGDRASADWRLGVGETGATYYASEAAALTATENGTKDWSALAGQTFCIRAGSPYEAAVEARFGAAARRYPSTAQALIGLKLGECSAVVDDRVLLENIAGLPEWRRYNRLLPPLDDVRVRLQVAAREPSQQQAVDEAIRTWQMDGRLAELTQHWIDEVAFQAYVLADTLDCH